MESGNRINGSNVWLFWHYLHNKIEFLYLPSYIHIFDYKTTFIFDMLHTLAATLKPWHNDLGDILHFHDIPTYLL
jgi:hypothetical protein